MIARLARRARDLLLRLDPDRERSDLRWWEERARRRGAASVYNSGHDAEQRARVDAHQKEVLFPVLRDQLRGDERTLVDFGCGPGRFTPDLARLVGGEAIGVDPIEALLDQAPRASGVEYRVMRDGRIPLPDRSVDVVWVCLVLTCITEIRAVRGAAAEIDRVLREDGLLFLVENTEPKKDLRHIAFRSVEAYRELFPTVALRHERDYQDRGERISVVSGRKRGIAGSG